MQLLLRQHADLFIFEVFDNVAKDARILHFRNDELKDIRMPVGQHNHLGTTTGTALFDQMRQLGDVIHPGYGSGRAAIDAFYDCMARAQRRTVRADAAATAHDFHDFFAVIGNATARVGHERHDITVEISDIGTRSGTVEHASGRDEIQGFLFFIEFQESFMAQFRRDFYLSQAMSITHRDLFVEKLQWFIQRQDPARHDAAFFDFEIIDVVLVLRGNSDACRLFLKVDGEYGAGSSSWVFRILFDRQNNQIPFGKGLLCGILVGVTIQHDEAGHALIGNVHILRDRKHMREPLDVLVQFFESCFKCGLCCIHNNHSFIYGENTRCCAVGLFLIPYMLILFAR